jgi:DNA gyrase/topoisomerase IV subunit A
MALEDLIVEEDMVVTISHEGYIKRNAVGLYRALPSELVPNEDRSRVDVGYGRRL